MRSLLFCLLLFTSISIAGDTELDKWKQKYPTGFEDLMAGYPELKEKSSTFRILFSSKLTNAEARSDPKLQDPNFLSSLAASIPRTPYVPSSSQILFEKKKLPPFETAGSGTLTVSNGYGSHAIVKLVSGDKKFFSFYIKPNESFRVDGIPEDSYRVIFAFSTDGAVRGIDSFSKTESVAEFQDGLTFTKSVSRKGDEIITSTSDIRLTLYGVINGNAKTKPSSEEEFQKF